MPPPTPLIPTLTLSFPSNDIPLEPTTPPLALPILDKRQTYVTVSVMKNGTDDSTSSSNKSSGFPVAIAIPALIGGMALALAGFGIWWWWTRKVKRERREAWEARQRRKRKRAEQSARPSVSSATRTPPSGGQKSPINEKGFVPPVPTLPKHAATQDPYKERGYGYSGQPQQQQQPQPHQNGGAFGYTTQPGLEAPPTSYGYDQYGQTIVQQPQQGYGGHSRAKSSDSTNPSNPFSNSNSAVPDLPPTSPTKEEPQSQPPAKGEKSSKRAQARMNIADSAAANASVDPAYRHQPKKPSPLALAAAERKAAEARMEHLAPPGEQSLPPYDNGNAPGANRATSGEWGVALGSPNNDGQFDFNRQQQQGQYDDHEDPYAQAQRAKSGMYAEDPYASYHGDEEDVYHKAAEGMGLGGGNASGSGTPKKSRWV
ncbi:hypothetical protein I302_102763 [Kwoniella bestiolae CBS 10118]|uniref:Uncharacterized protein n=1 Tax=Kwoniella bestiolae CBS 10118 TaxID=1296100 RepID=A0A1B9GFV9_9TREE|nr:hypothetical protein I302_01456 [Kwoniella bestiolae CBS 10118]OCF29943.1 hypothetical protein I302_01456 [Kwoniella bestiolae CBS 10118]